MKNIDEYVDEFHAVFKRVARSYPNFHPPAGMFEEYLGEFGGLSIERFEAAILEARRESEFFPTIAGVTKALGRLETTNPYAHHRRSGVPVKGLLPAGDEVPDELYEWLGRERPTVKA